MRVQRREFATPLLGGRFVVAVQYQGVATGTSPGQPLDGVGVVVEPVVISRSRGATNSDTGTDRASICAQNASTSARVCSPIPETETINFPDTLAFCRFEVSGR